MRDFRKMLENIQGTASLLERALKLAGLITKLFHEQGWDVVVVGGSAVEFYTEGAYMSGDIDLCRTTLKPIPPRVAQDTMMLLGAQGGPRSWKVAGLFVDLLGLLENEARTPFRILETPCGTVRLIPAELALVERVLPAYYPAGNMEAAAVARQMMAACVSGKTPVDWAEVERLAALPAFRIEPELARMRKEVADALKQ